jgi:hypothetical protein
MINRKEKHKTVKQVSSFLHDQATNGLRVTPKSRQAAKLRGQYKPKP